MSANDQILSASGFSPTNVSGLQAWYQVTPTTNPASVSDLSIAQGGGTLTSAVTRPVLTTNGSVNVLRWNGTTSTPLLGTPETPFTHIFIVACYTDATFTGYPGLIGAQTADVLVGGDGTQAFFDFGAGGYTYSLNGVVDPTLIAPRSGTLGIIQYTAPTTYTMANGLDIGLQKAIAGRIWKGDVALVLLYDNISMTAGQATQIRKWCGQVCGGIVTS